MTIARHSRILVTLALVATGCFPLLRSEAPPEEIPRALEALFEGDEELLVLPVWEKVPFWHTDTSKGAYVYFEAPIFIDADDLATLPELVDAKTTAMIIVGAGAAVGRGVEFQGFYVLSDGGRLAWLESRGTKGWILGIQHARLGDRWRDELIAVFTEGDDWTRDRSDLWENNPRRDAEIDCGGDDRDAVVEFVRGIDPAEDGPDVDAWQQIILPMR
jgi:hypothetical protein